MTWRQIIAFVSWRQFFGAIIGVLGTLIVFSPNFPPASKWYDENIPYFKSIKMGLDRLSAHEIEPNESDGRQKEKVLEIGEVGFDEILTILKSLKPEKLNGKDAEQITSRRAQWFTEGTGEYLDFVSLIHVKTQDEKTPYKLITTNQDLQVFAKIHRDRWIEGVGTLIIILGVFWPYIWQGGIVLIRGCRSKAD